MSWSTSEPVLAESRKAKESHPVLTFARSNIAWILGSVPLLLAGLRILTVSRGDSEVFLYLLKNLNVVHLIMATVVPLVPIAVFWAWVAWTDWQRRTPRAEQVQKLPDWVDIPIFISMSAVIFWMPTFEFIFCVLVLTFFITVRWLRLRKIRKKHGDDHGFELQPIIWNARGFGLSLVVATLLSSSVVWMPPEIIKVANFRQQTSYVLSTDDRWTTVLTSDRKIQVIQTANLQSRRPCTVSWMWLNRPLAKVLTSEPPYEICPR